MNRKIKLDRVIRDKLVGTQRADLFIFEKGGCITALTVEEMKQFRDLIDETLKEENNDVES